MDPKTLIEEISKAQKSRQKDYEIAMRGRVNENGKETGEGGYIAEAYKLESGHPELLDQNLHWSVRSSFAMQVAQKVFHDRQNRTGVAKSATEITKLETTQNLTELLKDPEKYGLEKKDVEGLLDAAWFINEGDEKLDPDEVANEIKSQKLADRIKKDANLPTDTRSANYTRYKNKIEKAGVNEDELFEERRTRTLSYLEQLALEQRQSKEKSNTAGQLRALEMDIAFLKSNNAKFSPGLRSKAIESIGSNTEVIRSAFQSEEALEFFKSPTKFLASKAGAAASKAVAAKVTGAMVTAGLTTVAPVVGTAVGWVAGQSINKAVVYGIDKAKKGAKLAVAAGAGFLIFVASTISVAAASVVGAVATLMILIPFIIALIIFIITSGGYIVPPGPAIDENGTEIITDQPIGGGVKENPYIRVVKTANPTGPFQNSQLPLEVEYRIEITAKQVPLTNISFEYDCEVVRTTPTVCPFTTPGIPPAPAEIVPGTPFVITYRVNYSLAYRDSIAMDTLTVTADAGSALNQEASGFASVIFGVPPTRCFVFQGAWPNREKAIMTQAVSQIVQAVVFSNKICGDGNVNLVYSPVQAYFQGKAYGGETAHPKITFFPLALGNIQSAFYTLAHELGHIISWRTNLLTDFRDEAPFTTLEGYICTYPFIYSDAGRRQSEDFAETVALYLVGQSLSSGTRDFTCMEGGDLSTEYENHWQFARQQIFEQQLSW